MKNITKFKKLLAAILVKTQELAGLYYEDLQKDSKAEAKYSAATPLTRTMLRRLESIAKGDMIPESFFVGNATVYRMMSTMSIEQQEKCENENMTVVAEDGSHWSKKFEDLSPRQMNMVYDVRGKEFRSDVAQREWQKANPVVKVSHAGLLPVVEVKPEAPKTKKPTKAGLIKELKKLDISAADLSKLADASTLMEAAQMALKVKA